MTYLGVYIEDISSDYLIKHVLSYASVSFFIVFCVKSLQYYSFIIIVFFSVSLIECIYRVFKTCGSTSSITYLILCQKLSKEHKNINFRGAEQRFYFKKML